jgi:hypothetical protein
MVVGKIQIYSIGPQDFNLTGNPQITFFKTVYRRHTRFSIRTEQIFFKGESLNFGSNDILTSLKREGDLLGDMYLMADITATCNDANGRHTVNHYGNSLIKKVECLVGTNVIDTHSNIWYQILDELYTKNYTQKEENITHSNGGKSTTFDFTTTSQNTFTRDKKTKGDYPIVFGGVDVDSNSVGAGTYTKRLKIPLKFWFNRNPDMYLPIVSLYNHDVDFRFNIETSANLIGDSTNISNMTANMKLFGTFIDLDDDEKRKFRQANHEYIIEQVQTNNGDTGITTASSEESNGNELSETTYDLNLLHPVKYLAWVIVNPGTSGSNSGQGPCYFTSLTNNSMFGNDGNFGSAQLYIGGIEREIKHNMAYFTRYQPSKYCFNTPELDRIGFYSFALKPLESEPTGTCNFSKIKDNFIRIKFSNNSLATIKSKQLHIFGVNYNVFVITNGQGMLLYT